MFVDRMQQLTEAYLANDGVVSNDEYVSILTEALQDGVQDYELQAAKQLLQYAQGMQQQALAIWQQQNQNLAYVQATAPTASAVIDSQNPLGGLLQLGLGGIGIAQHREQLSKAQQALRQAETQYNAMNNRVVAYQTIYNELRQRADWWTRLWN